MFNLTKRFPFLFINFVTSTYITLKIELIYTQMNSAIIKIMRLIQGYT